MSYLETVLDSGVCPKCQKESDDIDERYSFGYYAGVMCRTCAISSYRDGCGLTGEGQGDARELDDYGNDGDY